MADVFEPRAGLRMLRMVNGETVNPNKLDPKITNRIEAIKALEDKYKALKGAQDYAGLFELAKEYDALKMHTMAGRIRKEIAR